MLTLAIDCRKINDGGIGTYLSNMLKSWNKHQRDTRYILFGYAGDRKRFDHFGDSATFIEYEYGKYSVRELFSFNGYLKEHNADLFFSPHYTLPYNLPCKSIAVVHDLIHLKFPVKRGMLGRLYAKKMLRHACKKSEYIITDSVSSQNDLRYFYPKWESKYRVVKCGVDHDIFKPLPKDVVESLRKEKLLPDKFIFYAGALKNHKNPKALLAVAAALKTKLVICTADKEMFYNLQNSDINGGKYLIHKSAENFEELALLYNASELLFFPSLYEGFGLPPLEAMSCGTPVVCSNTASLPEVVGDNAITFSPDNQEEMINAVNYVLTDDNIKQTLSEKGIIRSKQFNWANSAAETFNIIKEVAQN